MYWRNAGCNVGKFARGYLKAYSSPQSRVCTFVIVRLVRWADPKTKSFLVPPMRREAVRLFQLEYGQHEGPYRAILVHYSIVVHLQLKGGARAMPIGRFLIRATFAIGHYQKITAYYGSVLLTRKQ